MFEEIITQILANNFIIQFLPFIILIHIITGIIAAIRQKNFQFGEIANYMKNGTLFLIFLLLIDLIYYGFNQSDIGYIIISGIETLRGISWLAVVCYYASKIYQNFVIFGMPKLTSVENEFKRQEDNENYIIKNESESN